MRSSSIRGDPTTGESGALAGLLAIELGELVSAPHAAKLLADFGADVVKVEHPAGGDPMRWRGPYPLGTPAHELGGQFEYFNSNKRSAAWDLTEPAQRRHFDALIERADILLTNLPAERVAALDLEPIRLRERYPALIVTTISPFGMTGPYAAYRGDELITYAMSGLAHVTPGMPDTAEDPEIEGPLHPACAVSETIAGVFAAVATMFAVLQRDRTGEGCHIDLSQQAATTLVEARGIPAFTYGGLLPGRVPPIGKMPNFYLPCLDGHVVVATFLDLQWARFVKVMGDPEWAQLDAFADGAGRTANWDALRALIGEWLADKSCDHLLRLGVEHHLPLFPVFTIRQLAGDPHVEARGSLVEVRRDGYTLRMPGPPVRMARTPWALRRLAPRLGEQTAEIAVP
ncbi:MAG: CoA transferase [Dehalococcoidia bacterium]